MIRGTDVDSEPHDVRVTDVGFEFRFGSAMYRYDRLGLQLEEGR